MLYTMKEKDGKWGFVNEIDEPICGFIYDEVRDFSEGIAAVRVDNKWGYINEDGTEICEIRYDAVGDFQSKLGVVEKEGKKCYLNTNGEEVAVTNFMNEEMVFEGCKSCAIGNHTITNLPGGYLYEDDFINGEIILKNCTKADGVRRVVDYYHGDMKDTIGFGDSMNDFQMIDTCEIGVVAENAPDKLKAIGTCFFKDPDADGLADAIYELKLDQ